jgi:hypothetical protein
MLLMFPLAGLVLAMLLKNLTRAHLKARHSVAE